MNNKIEVFKVEQFGEIRTALIENEPWFVAVDAVSYTHLDVYKRQDLRWMSGGCGNTFGIHRNKDCRAI